MWYHALNRANGREAVLHKPGDYDAFVEAMIEDWKWSSLPGWGRGDPLLWK
jgi:hypothetical protein